MSEKLAGYEVIMGLLGVYAEKTQTDKIRLDDRSNLYKAVRQICSSLRGKVSDFTFRRRRGRYISADVDLCLRNLEDSRVLECLNPRLVDFRMKPELLGEYKNCVRPKMERLGVLDLFLKLGGDL